MNSIAKRLFEIDEPYAAGYFEDTDRSYFYRMAKAMLRYREVCTLPEYNGEYLYPNGVYNLDKYAVIPQFSYGHTVNYSKLSQKDEEVGAYCKENMPQWHMVREEGTEAIFGGLYTHTNANYVRILKEGFDSYRERILKAKDKDFREGCLEVLNSIEIYRRRCVEYLKSVDARPELIAALEKVPFKPADTIYEALVGWNFIYYVDLCDNVGSMDEELNYWHKGEDIIEVLRNYYRNVDANDGWSLRVGPTIYPITYQIIKASKGIRRPSIELCIDETIPEDIWKLSTDLIKAGNTNPVFYNYPLYQSEMHKRFPKIPQCDLDKFTGCGCTETMLSGISRVGSVDGGVNLALVFCEYMNEQLINKATFEEFYEGACERLLEYINRMYDKVNENYKYRAEFFPHPVRTVLVDDCIDNETDFNAGGARWNWSVVNLAGTINVIESLLAIRDIVYEKKEYGAAEFLELLNNEDELFYKRLRKCPHYGINESKADSLANDFFRRMFTSGDGKETYFGDGFLTSSVQFTTYVRRGMDVCATPDGRKSHEPLCDSLSPIFGNDTKSLTSMLGSVSNLDLKYALGTPVVNLRLSKKYADELLKPMILGFFENGGMMLQINCVSREELEDAVINPDKHRDLLVRTGGFSEYFVNLSPTHQRTIIERTEHE